MALRTIKGNSENLIHHLENGKPVDVTVTSVRTKAGQYGPYLGVVANTAGYGKVWFSAPQHCGLEQGSTVEIVAEGGEPSDDGSITFLKRVTRAGAEKRAAPVPVELPGIERVQELFDAASESGLRFPKVKLELVDGTRIKLYRAGERSRYCGDVQVVEDLPFGEARYFGRIHEGQFVAGRDSNAVVLEALRGLAEDPAGFAAAEGHRTGNCCFCSRDLSDGRSVSVGYGPICADRFGLPWGEDG